MGKFSRLLQAKGVDVKIGDETYNIKPLTGKYLGLLMGLEDNKHEGIINLVHICLQQTDSDITREDVEELPLNVLMDVFEAISDVNELK